MAKAGFLARQDAEHRTILDREATRRVARRTPAIKSSHPDHSLEKKSLSQEIQRFFFVECPLSWS
jgi:hypothetical protein